MKNLKEIWSGVRLDAEKIKENYFAELLSIGVHGRTRLAVKLEDVDNYFYGSLMNLYISENDKDYRVKSFVRFTEKKEGNYETHYMVRIEHLKDSDKFRFTLTAGGNYSKYPRRRDAEGDMFELTVEEMSSVRTWKNILSRFSSIVQ